MNSSIPGAAGRDHSTNFQLNGFVGQGIGALERKSPRRRLADNSAPILYSNRQGIGAGNCLSCTGVQARFEPLAGRNRQCRGLTVKR